MDMTLANAAGAVSLAPGHQKEDPARMPNNIPYSRKLGPLTPFVGEWEGDAGVDRSYHNKDDWTTETA
jgi:hypothetical protein